MHGAVAPSGMQASQRRVKLACRGLWKVFGHEAAHVLALHNHQPSEEDLARASLVAAVRQADLTVHEGEIFIIMGLSGRTIEYHLARAFAALGVHTRIQAVVRARELGLLGPSDHRPPGPRTFSVQRRKIRRRID